MINEKTETGNFFKRYSNIQLLIIGFVLIIFIGSVILSLPISSKNGGGQSYIDALFTATSAVSTTGLIVEDTGDYYSLFGQIVILIMIQIGGLGYMVFIVMIFYLFTKNFSLRNNLLLKETISGVTFESSPNLCVNSSYWISRNILD